MFTSWCPSASVQRPNAELLVVAYSDDVNDGFQRDVNKRSGDVNKVGAQRQNTFAPRCATSLAVASPIPLLALVIATTLPSIARAPPIKFNIYDDGFTLRRQSAGDLDALTNGVENIEISQSRLFIAIAILAT